MTPRLAVVAATAAVTLSLAGCSTATTSPSPQPVTSSRSSTPSSSSTPTAATPTRPPRLGAISTVVDGLAAPWSMVALENGSTLVSLRDSGRVVEVRADGSTHSAGTVPGVVHEGEGGLLGLAVAPGDQATLYAYLTTASDNRIVRMRLSGTPGSLTIGAPRVLLAGLDRARNHDGGRLAFGADGMLYATVGDAGDPPHAQDLDSLNGKILRMTPTGAVPYDNPFPGSLVYSYGHRNPQGLAWDESGQLYAAEFGQDTWDEINRIEPGADYGWPTVEGIAHDDRFVDPLVQWPTDDASPSGLAFVDGAFWMAGLGGQRLWRLVPDGDGGLTAQDFFVGRFGRIRDVAAAPDGGLRLLTNNTDGRGVPRSGDDRILEVSLD